MKYYELWLEPDKLPIFQGDHAFSILPALESNMYLIPAWVRYPSRKYRMSRAARFVVFLFDPTGLFLDGFLFYDFGIKSGARYRNAQQYLLLGQMPAGA